MEVKEKNSVIVELHDLTITEQKDDRFGRVVTTKSLSVDDLVNIAVSRRTDLSATTLKSAHEILKNIALEQLANGASVHFGLGYFHLNVNGVFIGDNEKWDNAKHSLSVHVTPTVELRNAVKSCKVDVRGMAASPMAVNSVTDVTSGEVNSKLTPGGGVNIIGTRIKIEGDQAGIGIKLVNETTKEEILVPTTSMLTNSPSKLSFIVPTGLVAGDYRLVISTQHSSSKVFLKKPRTYIFEYLLVVDA
ncbi:DUF4469 domain-containing protein [Ancylomarina longa]|uniref:DUF4469 domain-containing protein n=1 Tax=Ancylomarina longa TaxID=2487017 RepID=A0A434AZ01_9BACT|nr:DUF4469 domain-containing protein [Ancylomarina longa]RUT79851.1 DUF4469 domain-containing protein [Ancylomarina longa]